MPCRVIQTCDQFQGQDDVGQGGRAQKQMEALVWISERCQELVMHIYIYKVKLDLYLEPNTKDCFQMGKHLCVKIQTMKVKLQDSILRYS